MELPAPISIADLPSMPNTRVPRTYASPNVLDSTIASMATPAMPTSAMF